MARSNEVEETLKRINSHKGTCCYPVPLPLMIAHALASR